MSPASRNGYRMPGPRRMRLRPTAASHSTSPAARSKRLRAEKALARDVEEAEAEPFFVGGLDPQRLGVELAEAPEVEMLGRREVPQVPDRRVEGVVERRADCARGPEELSLDAGAVRGPVLVDHEGEEAGERSQRDEDEQNQVPPESHRQSIVAGSLRRALTPSEPRSAW